MMMFGGGGGGGNMITIAQMWKRNYCHLSLTFEHNRFLHFLVEKKKLSMVKVIVCVRVCVARVFVYCECS